MKPLSIRARIFRSFLLVIILPGMLTMTLNFFLLRNNILNRAQQQVVNDLRVAHALYDNETDMVRRGFEQADVTINPAQLKRTLELDYLFSVERSALDSILSPVVRRAFTGNANGGARVIDSSELAAMGSALRLKAQIAILPTLHSRKATTRTLSRALALEYAMPLANDSGRVTRVIYGGKIINRYFGLVDKIHDIVYYNDTYETKPRGTVTVFLDDVRIATNVPMPSGDRAVGTRASEEVYRTVVEKGKPWVGRAFVVSDWRLTAYEPIRDVNGAIVGMMYVGVLEKPYTDLIARMLVTFLVIIGGGIMLTILISVVLSGWISLPLTTLVGASKSIATGDLRQKIGTTDAPQEINELAVSFNEMTTRLLERETRLTTANTELTALNKRYLDMVDLVSHELKGVLSSTMLNAYSVKDLHLGPVNDKQLRAMTSVARNLEYFDETIRRFLDLSRFERGELTLSRTDFLLREDVLDEVLRMFKPSADEKQMAFDNRVPQLAALNADRSLIFIAMNNLIGNALKYGTAGTTVTVSARRERGMAGIEVSNEGRPLDPSQCALLFQRFSRLDTPETRTTHGAGLGLFITREIVTAHGGTIRCEPRAAGNSFIISIPAVPVDSKQARHAGITGEPEGEHT